jgi:Holliday junction resolvase RusA-like endonuclease
LVILGAPRTKKNHSRIVTTRTGVPFIVPSKEYKVWEATAVLQMKTQWREQPIRHPVNVRALVYRERAAGDLVNFMQAIGDALQVANVVVDDKFIVSWDGSRLRKDAKRPRVELEITPAADDDDGPLFGGG